MYIYIHIYRQVHYMQSLFRVDYSSEIDGEVYWF